jgi:mRNA-degrading endonuclease RelE of RelBE toxin-antitoxin system
MKEAESFELIALCEGILDDAEVTVDEVRHLADWLAAHEEARRAWPGEVLTVPVQEALLDGKINKTELAKRHLRYQPTRVSKSRIKRLRGLSQPQYRLRVGEVRVFYDVTAEVVQVLAIVTKAEATAWLADHGTPDAPGSLG